MKKISFKEINRKQEKFARICSHFPGLRGKFHCLNKHFSRIRAAFVAYGEKDQTASLST